MAFSIFDSVLKALEKRDATPSRPTSVVFKPQQSQQYMTPMPQQQKIQVQPQPSALQFLPEAIKETVSKVPGVALNVGKTIFSDIIGAGKTTRDLQSSGAMPVWAQQPIVTAAQTIFPKTFPKVIDVQNKANEEIEKQRQMALTKLKTQSTTPQQRQALQKVVMQKPVNIFEDDADYKKNIMEKTPLQYGGEVAGSALTFLPIGEVSALKGAGLGQRVLRGAVAGAPFGVSQFMQRPTEELTGGNLLKDVGMSAAIGSAVEAVAPYFFKPLRLNQKQVEAFTNATHISESAQKALASSADDVNPLITRDAMDDALLQIQANAKGHPQARQAILNIEQLQQTNTPITKWSALQEQVTKGVNDPDVLNSITNHLNYRKILAQDPDFIQQFTNKTTFDVDKLVKPFQKQIDEAVTTAIPEPTQVAQDVGENLAIQSATKTAPNLLENVAQQAKKPTRQFFETIKQSAETTPQLRQALKSVDQTYDVLHNVDLEQSAIQRVKQSVDAAENFIRSTKEVNPDQTATAIQLIKHFQGQGTKEGFEKASIIADDIATKLTKAGQTIQAAKLYSNLSPEGVVIRAQKMIREINDKKFRWQKEIKLDQSTSQKLHDLATQMQVATGDLKQELSYEVGSMLDSLRRSTLGSKISMGQTIFQLFNPKTLVTRNPMGNELFYRLERMNKYVATPIDWAKSALTGADRTVTFKTVKQGEYWKNWLTGLQAGWKGKAINNLPTQLDIPHKVFKSKWNPLYWGEKALGASIKSFDNAAFMRAKNQTVGELAYLNALNRGLKGKAAVVDAQKLMQKMDTRLLQIADDYGRYVTFQDENLLSKGFSTLKRVLNAGQDFGAGDLVIKYPRTPGALLMRSIEYSPAGFLKSAYEVANPILRGKPVNSREAIMSLSRGITGTLGFTGLGYYLADKGILTGSADKDKDLNSLQRSTGVGQYKVNLSALKRWVLSGFQDTEIKPGDMLYSYDWAQPIAVSLSMGANANKNVKENKDATTNLSSTVAESIAGGVGTLQEQSLVSGLKRLFGYGDVVGGALETVKGVPSSFVPTIFNQFKQVYDPLSRETESPSFLEESKNLATAKIPGLSDKLPARMTTLGEPQTTYQEGHQSLFNIFLNPGFVTNYVETPESKLVLDIYKNIGETKQLPRTVPKKVTINGEQTDLNNRQISALQQYVGRVSKDLLNQLANSPEFQGYTDEEKSKSIANLLDDIGSAAKFVVLEDRPERMSSRAEEIVQQSLEHLDYYSPVQYEQMLNYFGGLTNQNDQQ